VYAFGIILLEAISGIRRRSEFPLHRWVNIDCHCNLDDKLLLAKKKDQSLFLSEPSKDRMKSYVRATLRAWLKLVAK